MGFKKFLGKVADKIEDVAEDIKESREEKRRQEEKSRAEEWQRKEKARKYREEIENKVNRLLDKFEIPDFDNFLMKYLNDKPETEKEYDEETGKTRAYRPSRKDYLEFVWDHLDDDEINYDQLKDFALKHRIVSPSFFGDSKSEEFEKSDFETIINSLKVGFQPEAITNEEHLEAQLTIFLKAKFPDRKVQRQLTTKNGDQLDIVVNDKYVFELKVPRNRTHLRNLSAQIEEYVEQYPNLCVVIADISRLQMDGSGDVIEANLTQNIREYADKYKTKFGVETLVFDILTRK